MSRIDEALKRAAGGELARADQGSGILGAAGPGAVMLEDYPGELAGSSAVAVEPPRRPSARVRTADVGRLQVSPAFPSKLVVGPDISPVAVEQYRRLAATMHDLQAEKGLKSVLVTSAVPREGKTLSVTNLALTLSEAYRRRVVLVDADLRRPAVHEVLGIPNRRGLRDVLLQGHGSSLPLVQASPLLAVLPAGQPDPNPIAGLASERMRELLGECAKSFDWVLLDAPPVMLLPDAGLLSKLIDGVVFVIGAGSTPFPMVERAIAELGQDCIIGTVLNRVEERTIPATGYYHQYYHTNRTE